MIYILTPIQVHSLSPTVVDFTICSISCLQFKEKSISKVKYSISIFPSCYFKCVLWHFKEVIDFDGNHRLKSHVWFLVIFPKFNNKSPGRWMETERGVVRILKRWCERGKVKMVRDEEEGQRQSMKNKEESDRKTQDEKKKTNKTSKRFTFSTTLENIIY